MSSFLNGDCTIIGGTIDNVIIGATTAAAGTFTTGTFNTSVLSNDVDARTATTLLVGASTATRIEIGDTGIITSIEGSCEIVQSLTVTGNTIIGGNLTVNGTTTSIDTENVLIEDPNLYLNQGYTTAVARNGGLVINYLPTATATTTIGAGVFVAGVDTVSNPSVTTAGLATFAAGDLIQISGADDAQNNGLFEVASHAAGLLQIKSTAAGVTNQVETFTQNQFTANAGDTGCTLTKVGVSVIRAALTGNWETGFGNTTPITFNDITTGISITGVDNYIVRMDGTNDIKDSLVLIDNSGNLRMDSAPAQHIIRSNETLTLTGTEVESPSSNVDCTFLNITNAGTKTGTLSDGTIIAQEHIIACIALSGSGVYDLTVTNFQPASGSAGSKILRFNSAGQSVHLIWGGSNWISTNSGVVIV